jgi:hypothetical protein
MEKELTLADIKKLFLETREQMKETDKKFQETDRLLKEITGELGGIGKSNGAIAEDFFYTALANKMQVNKFNFDYIDRNFDRKRNSIQAQYDIILYNNYKVMIVEVKYNFKKKYLLDFYKNIKKFKILFPEYKEFKIYGAIAGMTFEDEAIEEAKEFGFFVLTQNNQNLQILNENDFEPNAIK